MTTLTVTAQGQVTFRREMLNHLGIEAGGEISVALLPDGRAELKAESPKRSWRQVYGMLEGKGYRVQLSIEDINDAVIEAGSKAAMAGLRGT